MTIQEFVVTHLGDRFSTGDGPRRVLSCGTEDVLTCHVIVLHHAFTQVTALAHFDEFIRDRGLTRFTRYLIFVQLIPAYNVRSVYG